MAHRDPSTPMAPALDSDASKRWRTPCGSNHSGSPLDEVGTQPAHVKQDSVIARGLCSPRPTKREVYSLTTKQGWSRPRPEGCGRRGLGVGCHQATSHLRFSEEHQQEGMTLPPRTPVSFTSTPKAHAETATTSGCLWERTLPTRCLNLEWSSSRWLS